jgi:phosphodiesterase/alkaline phosphatase D-like protein
VGSSAAKNTANNSDTIIKSLVNNFGKNPESSRNFTWYTTPAIKNGILQYCAKSSFEGFDKSNIITVNAQSSETKTNADKRVIHKVQLNNLKAGTEYVYRVGTGKGGFGHSR